MSGERRGERRGMRWVDGRPRGGWDESRKDRRERGWIIYYGGKRIGRDERGGVEA